MTRLFAKLTKSGLGFGLPVDIIHRARTVVVDKTQYPANIFKLWSTDELNKIGYAPLKVETIPAGMVSTGTVDTLLGGEVIRSQKLIDDPALLDKQRASVCRSLKGQRDSVIGAGLPWGDEVVQTDAASRAMITGTSQRLGFKSSDTVQYWRMMSDTAVAFTVTEFNEMAVAVADLVDGAYIRYGMLEAEIKASADPMSIDITAGWPDHYDLEGDTP